MRRRIIGAIVGFGYFIALLLLWVGYAAWPGIQWPTTRKPACLAARIDRPLGPDIDRPLGPGGVGVVPIREAGNRLDRPPVEDR